MAKKSAAKVAESAPAEEARIEYVRLPDIQRAKRNPKLHEVQTIVASIRRHGFVAPLVENAKTGRIVAGHGRLEAVEAIKVETPDKPPARVKVDKDGEWMVPVVRGVSFPSEQRAEEYLMADNRLVELGGWNDVDLAPMLAEIAARGQAAITAIGWSSDDVEYLVGKISDRTRIDAMDQRPDAIDKIPKRARDGDVWTMGDHAMVVGDSRDDAVWAKLFGNETCDMIFTSPPYNVGIQYDDHDDRMQPKDYEAMVRGVIANAVRFTKTGRMVAWNVGVSPNASPIMHAVWLGESGLQFRRQIVWEKVGTPVPIFQNTERNMVARNYIPNYCHEMIYLYSKGDVEPGGAVFVPDTIRNDVWRVPSSSAGGNGHPAAFPVDIAKYTIAAMCSDAEIVCDPFGGSGTTLLAAESMCRRAMLIEMSPRYADIAIFRWEQMTGKKAVLEKGDRKPKAATKKAATRIVSAPVAAVAQEDTEAA